MKKQILCILYSAILILGILLLVGCESPTAVKERNKSTQEVRNNNGGRG